MKMKIEGIQVGDWVRLREGAGIGTVWAIAKDVSADQHWFIIGGLRDHSYVAVVRTAIIDVRQEPKTS